MKLSSGFHARDITSNRAFLAVNVAIVGILQCHISEHGATRNVLGISKGVIFGFKY